MLHKLHQASHGQQGHTLHRLSPLLCHMPMWAPPILHWVIPSLPHCYPCSLDSLTPSRGMDSPSAPCAVLCCAALSCLLGSSSWRKEGEPGDTRCCCSWSDGGSQVSQVRAWVLQVGAGTRIVNVSCCGWGTGDTARSWSSAYDVVDHPVVFRWDRGEKNRCWSQMRAWVLQVNPWWASCSPQTISWRALI